MHRCRCSSVGTKARRLSLGTGYSRGISEAVDTWHPGILGTLQRPMGSSDQNAASRLYDPHSIHDVGPLVRTGSTGASRGGAVVGIFSLLGSSRYLVWSFCCG